MLVYLGTGVGVIDHPVDELIGLGAGEDRHLQGVQGKAGGHRIGGAPPDDPAGEHNGDKRSVHLTPGQIERIAIRAAERSSPNTNTLSGRRTRRTSPSSMPPSTCGPSGNALMTCSAGPCSPRQRRRQNSDPQGRVGGPPWRAAGERPDWVAVRQPACPRESRNTGSGRSPGTRCTWVASVNTGE